MWEAEEYETELERMNMSMSMENYALQHDNKQLAALIKEYEAGLDGLMSEYCVVIHCRVAF